MRTTDERTYLIDFGLGYHTDHVEDYAMDLHVFDQSLVGTADDPEPLRDAVREGTAKPATRAYSSACETSRREAGTSSTNRNRPAENDIGDPTGFRPLLRWGGPFAFP